jgi:hypothetical protein
MRIFNITGKVISRESKNGIKGLKVEAWDKDLFINDLVGSATTGDGGVFRLQFDESYFKELFLDRKPDLFFKVYRGARLITSTEGSVLWNVDREDIEQTIEVEGVNNMTSSENKAVSVRQRGSEVFRFVTLRPLQRQDEAAIEKRKVLSYKPMDEEVSEFHRALLEAKEHPPEGSGPREAIVATAKVFVETAGSTFVRNIHDLSNPHAPRSAQNRSYESSLGLLEEWIFRSNKPVSYEHLLSEIKNAYNNTNLNDIVQSHDFQTDLYRLQDSIMALAINAFHPHSQRDRLVNALRICRIIERLAEDDGDLMQPYGIDKAMKAPVVLPTNIFPLPPARGPAIQPHSESGMTREQEVKKLREQRNNLKTAVEELVRLSSDDYIPPSKTQVKKMPAVAAEWKPWTLKQATIDRLLDTTRQVIQALGCDLVRDSVPNVINILEGELARVGAQLFRPSGHKRIIRRGESRMEFLPGMEIHPWQPGDLEPVRVPQSVGVVKPAGVGEYNSVRQVLLRYEPGEIAHIENVLRGEYKERVHRRLRRMEEEITYEEETTSTTEKDLQSTDRYELKREASETIKEEHKADAGVTVKYDGPSVDVEAKAGYNFAYAKEQSKKTSVSYARDVTEKSLSRLEEKVRELRVTKTIEEFEETNTHGIDNKGKADHAVGVYRWVDKLYEAQVIGYGERLFFDFVIPEPAAFYLYALTHGSTNNIEEPLPPMVDENGDPALEPETAYRALEPGDISIENYQSWAARYSASDIAPPPARYILSDKASHGQASEDNGQYASSSEFEIPAGYKAIDYLVAVAMHDVGIIKVTTGYNIDSFFDSGRTSWKALMETDKLGLAALALGMPSYSYTVVQTIRLERTFECLEQWQQQTYDAIIQAYLIKKAKYEEQLTMAAMQEGVSISGRNPAQNREIEETELKRGALSLITGQYFELFNAMQTDRQGYPGVNFAEAEAEGSYIQFFEHAFQWPLMTYLFYPYFWGQRQMPWHGGPTWIDKIVNIQDVDSLFDKFLKAGAARVTVPVRPGFEEAVLNYLSTTEIWNGGEKPTIDDPLYVSIVEEIQQQQGAYVEKSGGTISVEQDNAQVVGSETDFKENDVDREIYIEGKRYVIAMVEDATHLTLAEPYRGETRQHARYYIGARLVGGPWEVRVPTTLVYLQEDATLPDFTEET